MTDTCLLKAKIKDSGYKMGFIAASLGLSRQGLNNKIENKQEFRASEIQTLCDLLKIKTEEKEKIFFSFSS